MTMAGVSESEDIRRSLKPIFISTWLFGVPRVSYKFSYRFMYAVLVTASYVATFLYTIDKRLNTLKKFPITATLYVTSYLIASGSVIGTILFWTTKGAQALEDAIMELAELDVELKSLGIQIKHQNVFRRQIWLIVVFVTLWGIIVTMHQILIIGMSASDLDGIFKHICTWYSTEGPLLIVVCGESVFSIITYAFRQRFEWLNRGLRVLWKNEELYDDSRASIFLERNTVDLSITKLLSTEELLTRIGRLYKTHQHLCELSDKVSSNFSSQLYITISASFVLLAYRVIFLYTLTLIQFERQGASIALTILWIAFYILKFWTITLTCYFTSVEANKFGIMLHGIEINDQRFYRMLQVYSVQLYQNKLQFGAGGFFKIDLSLSGALISTITTYIVVAVDVWSGDETESKNSTEQ